MAANFRVLRGNRMSRYQVSGDATAIAVGDLLVLEADGYVAKAGAADTSLIGVAAQASVNDTEGEEILVCDDPHAWLVGTADAAVSQTLRGQTCDITAAQLVDIGATSTNVLKIVDIGSNYDPLLDGTFTTFDDGKSIIVQIAAHSLDA